MPAQIKITVSPSGEIKTEVQGVAGPSCKDVAPWLAQLGRTLEEGATSDFYREDDQVTNAWSNL